MEMTNNHLFSDNMAPKVSYFTDLYVIILENKLNLFSLHIYCLPLPTFLIN